MSHEGSGVSQLDRQGEHSRCRMHILQGRCVRLGCVRTHSCLVIDCWSYCIGLRIEQIPALRRLPKHILHPISCNWWANYFQGESSSCSIVPYDRVVGDLVREGTTSWALVSTEHFEEGGEIVPACAGRRSCLVHSSEDLSSQFCSKTERLVVQVYMINR